jgi:GTP-dependent phosphoenolpyruvate carboxykinase
MKEKEMKRHFSTLHMLRVKSLYAIEKDLKNVMKRLHEFVVEYKAFNTLERPVYTFDGSQEAIKELCCKLLRPTLENGLDSLRSLKVIDAKVLEDPKRKELKSKKNKK